MLTTEITERCACESCACDELATHTLDGLALCDACGHSVLDEDGNYLTCERQMDGKRCHECGERIDWGQIEIHAPGRSNTMRGTCGCSRGWRAADEGGHWHYAYLG